MALQGDPSWQAVLRALSALEAVIQQGSTAACGEIAVFFQASIYPWAATHPAQVSIQCMSRRQGSKQAA